MPISFAIIPPLTASIISPRVVVIKPVFHDFFDGLVLPGQPVPVKLQLPTSKRKPTLQVLPKLAVTKKSLAQHQDDISDVALVIMTILFLGEVALAWTL